MLLAEFGVKVTENHGVGGSIPPPGHQNYHVNSMLPTSGAVLIAAADKVAAKITAMMNGALAESRFSAPDVAA